VYSQLGMACLLLTVANVASGAALQFTVDPNQSHFDITQKIDQNPNVLNAVEVYAGSMRSPLTGTINADVDFAQAKLSFANPSQLVLGAINPIPTSLYPPGGSVNIVATTDFGNGVELVNGVRNGLITINASGSPIQMNGSDPYLISAPINTNLSFQYLDYFIGPGAISNDIWNGFSGGVTVNTVGGAELVQMNNWHWELILPFEVDYTRYINNYNQSGYITAHVVMTGYIVATAAVPEASSLVLGFATLLIGSVVFATRKLKAASSVC